MKKQIYKIVPILILFLLATGVKAQQQIIKTSPLGYVYGMYNLQYERMLTDYSAINVSASYLKPNLFDQDEYIIDFLGLDISEKLDINGVALNLDYRLFSQNQAGPRGFYIAPYLRYMRVASLLTVDGQFMVMDKHDNLVEVDHIETGFTLDRYGYGIKLGVQWLIADRFSIDWNFGGIGADLYKTVTITDEGYGYDEEIGYYPTEDKTTTFDWNYAFSTNLTIGFAF